MQFNFGLFSVDFKSKKSVQASKVKKDKALKAADKRREKALRMMAQTQSESAVKAQKELSGSGLAEHYSAKGGPGPTNQTDPAFYGRKSSGDFPS